MIAEAVRTCDGIARRNEWHGNRRPNLPTGKLDAKKDYPLGQQETGSGALGDRTQSLTKLRWKKLTSGKLTFDDVKIRPETLEYQAQIAKVPAARTWHTIFAVRLR